MFFYGIETNYRKWPEANLQRRMENIYERLAWEGYLESAGLFCRIICGGAKLEIQYSKQAIKFLKRQDVVTRKRIIHAINAIPLGDIKKLQGESGYRLRVGDYRIIFDKFGNILYIIKIDNRGQVYKK